MSGTKLPSVRDQRNVKLEEEKLLDLKVPFSLYVYSAILLETCGIVN